MRDSAKEGGELGVADMDKIGYFRAFYEVFTFNKETRIEDVA